VNGVFEILDEAFIAKVLDHFKNMRKDFIDGYNKYN
jgi:Glu-tRNA(Gln) amidotransferase subunit E-like FAD-binding protein